MQRDAAAALHLLRPARRRHALRRGVAPARALRRLELGLTLTLTLTPTLTLALTLTLDSATDDDAAGSFAHALHKVTADLEVPTLQGFGVDEATFRKAVPRMATDALASGSPGNNPVVPSQAQIEGLFHELWDHECRASAAG